MSDELYRAPVSGLAERRQEPRTFARARVSVVLNESRTLDGEAVDVSSAGVCVTLAEPLQLGALYRLNLEGASMKDRNLMGRVCFCLPQHESYRVGLHCAGLGDIGTTD
jgi:hypothetical protein